MAHLKIQIDSNIFQLREIIEAISIGRGDHTINDITINDPQCSRSHARIYFEDGNIVLEDDNSSYGTFVNDKRVDKKILKNGDMIKIANQQISYVEENIPSCRLTVDYRDIRNLQVDWYKVLQAIDVSFIFPTVFDILDQGLTVISEKINLLAKVGVVESRFFHSVRSAISNAAKHGNQNHSALCIFVRISIIGDKFLVDIRDQGKGFDYIKAIKTRKVDIKTRDYKGVGLNLIINGADEVEWNFVGNRIRLWKKLAKQTSKLKASDFQDSLLCITNKQNEQIF